MELVTLATFWTPHQAELAKSALDAAGIESFIEDADTSRQTTAAAVGGVKLRVRGDDAERAREVLESSAVDVATDVAVDSEPIETHVAEPVIEPGCPECGSNEIVRTTPPLTFLMMAIVILGVAMAIGLTEVAFFLILALAVYMLVAGRSRCTECGESWR